MTVHSDFEHMKQFQAGFILDNLLDPFPRESKERKIAIELCRWLSHFNVNTSREWIIDPSQNKPIYSVLINLLQRGLPTRLNQSSLEHIVNQTPLVDWRNDDYSFKVAWKTDSPGTIKKLIFRSLHIIDPRIDRENAHTKFKESWELLGSQFEEDFLFNSLPKAIGQHGDFICQLLTCQRSVNNIISEFIPNLTLPDRVRTNFEEQRTDFSIELPYYTEQGRKGLVIEIDGPQHQNTSQRYLDTERDKAVGLAGWYNTARIRTVDFNTNYFVDKVKNYLTPLLQSDYLKIISYNYSQPIWTTTIGREILELTLTPFGIARIQRVLIEAIVCGKLSMTAKEWNIAVIERDVPCAQIAFMDIAETLRNLNELLEEKIPIPKVNLEIYSTETFIESSLQSISGSNLNFYSDFDSSKEYDLLIDISILEREAFTKHPDTKAVETIVIRSCHYLESIRKVVTSDYVKYLPFCNKTHEEKWIIDDHKVKSLEYFLCSFFRKKHFLLGQVPIINKALQCKSVIGLLATGGGKSLTYQISALLQPGICMVIDPIKSLMKDQVDGLNRNMIDACILINSTLKGEDKRKAMAMMALGRAQFVFVTPERLQMEEFRAQLKDMNEHQLFFNYCVIDEAHCVSEWGHDFRTSYLRLGENAIRYCRTAARDQIPLFGLTATASYDVLADVQRELSGNSESRRLDEDAIIRFESTKRPELQFIVEEVSFPTNEIKTIWDLKKVLGAYKLDRVKAIMADTPFKLREFAEDPLLIFNEDDWKDESQAKQMLFDKIKLNNYDPIRFFSHSNAGLIFCPHTKGSFGVTDKFKIDKNGHPVTREGYYDILSQDLRFRAGYFMGSGSDQDETTKIIQEESFENQEKFINNELNLMVATKAFGMGIDKENIRYTIHINYPGSIESYVQEAGRAGRDRKLAISYLLFNEQKVSIDIERIENDLEVNMHFHRRSFKGVVKELAVLNELLTEIYFPDRTFELENLINQTLEIDVKCNYWEGGANKRLYINQNFTESLGYVDLITLHGNDSISINPELSQRIFTLVNSHISGLHLAEPAYLWILQSDNQIGIEGILRGIRPNESFKLTVGFFNNVKYRVKTITAWLQKVIHSNFTEAEVQKMRANSTDADGFIDQIIKKYQYFTHGNELDFETTCNNRDRVKRNPVGTAYETFHALFNGYRDKVDTEKAIYRLSTLGIIDDYTVNFSSNTFTLYGKKKPDGQYKKNLRDFMLKYYSEKTTTSKLKAVEEIDEPTEIRKCLSFLISFVYQEIQKKRELAIHDMKFACRFGLEKGSVELKDYIDLYFNSKYARNGYSYFDKNGREVNASLADLTNNGKNEDLQLVYKFIDIIEEDPKASQIDNTKHLRGACMRMLRNNPENYTLLLLNAFSLYMLEFKNPRFLLEAESLLQAAFSSISEKEPHMNDENLEKIFIRFTQRILSENKELAKYMAQQGFSFDFDHIMIKRLVNPLRKISTQLHHLNQILN